MTHFSERVGIDALRTLIHTDTNRRRLTQVLGIELDPELPPRLRALLGALDEVEQSGSSADEHSQARAGTHNQ